MTLAKALGCLAALVLSTALSCTWGHEAGDDPEARPVVLPGEAHLGATVLMAIDSNYIPVADQWERHDLHREPAFGSALRADLDRTCVLSTGARGGIEEVVRCRVREQRPPPAL